MASSSYPVSPDVRPTQAERIAIVEHALDQVLRAQREEEIRGATIERSADEAFYRWSADHLRLPLAHARLACVVLNSKPADVRRRFLGSVFDMTTTTGRRAGTESTEREVWRAIRRAIQRVAADLSRDLGPGATRLTSSTSPREGT